MAPGRATDGSLVVRSAAIREIFRARLSICVCWAPWSGRSFAHLYNVALPTTNREDSAVRLLRAYLDAVTLSEALQTRIWHAAELTLVQVRVLRRLAKQPRSLGQLGADLMLAPPSMTRLIDRLEERGLIERRRDDDDRRKVLATITPEGRRLVSAIPFLEGTPIRTAVERMTVADRERIAAAMHEFSAAVRHVEEESLLVETEA
jgi:DNA-binding MarR family transcriptional regulator